MLARWKLFWVQLWDAQLSVIEINLSKLVSINWSFWWLFKNCFFQIAFNQLIYNFPEDFSRHSVYNQICFYHFKKKKKALNFVSVCCTAVFYHFKLKTGTLASSGPKGWQTLVDPVFKSPSKPSFLQPWGGQGEVGVRSGGARGGSGWQWEPEQGREVPPGGGAWRRGLVICRGASKRVSKESAAAGIVLASVVVQVGYTFTFSLTAGKSVSSFTIKYEGSCRFFYRCLFSGEGRASYTTRLFPWLASLHSSE